MYFELGIKIEDCLFWGELEGKLLSQITSAEIGGLEVRMLNGTKAKLGAG